MKNALAAEQDFAGRQALGRRDGQEDAYAFSLLPARGEEAAGLLLIVADGMGGHVAGQRASELAVQSFAAAFHRGDESIARRLSKAVESSNQALGDAVEENPVEYEGMGSTLLAAVLTPRGLEWASVGDSPLWVWQGGALRRVNADHSFRPLLGEMVAGGQLSPEQAAHSSLRNRLRAALHGGEIALCDSSPEPLVLAEDDLVLAASDGLHTLSDDAIAALLQDHAGADAAEIASVLIQAVLQMDEPRQDNITVAVVKPRGEWLRGAALRPVFETGEETTRRIVPTAPAS
jgi:protein phosphatase